MQEWHLTLLIVASLTGAFLFAWKEAAMIVAGKDLNHFLLTVFRLSLALLVLTPTLPRPVDLPILLMAIVMMMGVFAPAHRLCLNHWRETLGHRIPWYHLGTGFYDNLLTPVIPATKFRFLTLCATELLIASAAYTQLTP